MFLKIFTKVIRYKTCVLLISGTTGNPKGIVRATGGELVGLNWVMNGVFGLLPGQPWFAATDIGWVVSQKLTCYAPLMTNNPSLIYEGKPVLANADYGERV